MKRTEELKHLQDVLLKMMGKIDALCRENNIPYYLNGGNALGAIRHGGFIPWDDDFDIMMYHSDYIRFINLCRETLDPRVWYVQEAWKDWPGCFSKIRLKGTYLEDVGEWDGIKSADRGIYVDIFEIVSSPSCFLGKWVQYTAAKLLNSYSLLLKGYRTDSKIKKVALYCSRLLKNKRVNRFCKWIVFRYEGKNTNFVGVFWGQSRFKNAFFKSSVFQKPYYSKFENIELPLPTLYIDYLRQTFGDYMSLPPKEKQKPAHSMKIDFGNY